jgi:GT2 family glycosyltransferase/cytochrome c-type biogenesis protein CcmH/NrfG/predicted SAM-dependent methyltransferase
MQMAKRRSAARAARRSAAPQTVPTPRPTSAGRTSRVEVFSGGQDTGYLGNRQSWWFDPEFEHSFRIFDLDEFHNDTYFEQHHVGEAVVKNYVDYVLAYGREFLGRDVKSLLELGCGGGWFTQEFLARGIDVIAVEGSRQGFERALGRGVPPQRIIRHDLRQPLDLGRTFDMVVCTEVAEHIECPFSSQLIANITRHGDFAWFSYEEPATNAAHYHHCNEQPTAFWEQLFRYYGRSPLWLPAQVMASVELRGNAVFYPTGMVLPASLQQMSSPGPVTVRPVGPADQLRRMVDQTRAAGRPVRLHLGCGYQVKNGYINIDLYTPAADVQLDITDLGCIEDNSVDEIYLNAVFEHLFGFEHRPALAEWRRVLKPGGTLRMDSVPDFDEIVRAYINKAPGNSGGTFDIEEVSRYTHGAPAPHDKFGQIHKDVFNRQKIVSLLEGAGFEITEMRNECWRGEPNPVNLSISAVKSRSGATTKGHAAPTVSTIAHPDYAPLPSHASAPSFAAVYCVHDDHTWLAESVESIYPCCAAIYVLVSERPWQGEPGDYKSTLELVRGLPDPECKIRLVQGTWNTEADQRNAGLAMLSEAGHQYCLVIDADEVYDTTDLHRMMTLARNNSQVDCWHAAMDTYWKSWRYRIDPREPLKPPVFLKVGNLTFSENRNVPGGTHGLMPTEAGIIHHLSYARTDEQLLRKIATFSHAQEILDGWFENVWKRWDSDRSLVNLHPTHPAAYGRAMEQPYWALPPVLRRKWEAERSESVSSTLPKTSIVILARNQLEYTARCLESIDRWTPEPHEVIVVDNASTDGTREFLKQWAADHPEFRAITSETNLGFAGGNNLGMGKATGDYVLLLNNDVVVTPGWLERLLACAARDPQIGIVGPVTNCVSGPQYVDQPLYDTTSLGGLDQFAREWSAKHTREVAPIWRTVGFCMLISRALIERIGGLDTRYGLGNFEDDDYCIRSAIAGFRCVIARDCYVHHYGSRTFAGEQIDYNALLAKNWEVYKKKWNLPANLRYGAPYSLADILKQPFDPSRHRCAIGAPSSDAAVDAAGPGPRVSLCMIAKNEERFLADCLASVDGVVDEIVFVDTGSTDRTIEIAKGCGAAIYQFEWTENYSDARNEALKHATGDWILMLDADERLDPAAKAAILRAVRASDTDAYELLFHNYCREGSSSPDIVHRVCRLMRNRPEYRFQGRIHENNVPSIVASGGVIRELDAIVHHYGYRADVKKDRNKHERYLKLLHAELEDKPDDVYVLHHISAAYCAEEEFDKAIPYLERLVDLIPTGHAFTGQAHSRLMNAYWATRRCENALLVAERARERGVEHPEITFSAANALLGMGRHKEAIEAFEAAIALGRTGNWLGDPGTYGIKARFGIARACAADGDFERAAAMCREVVREQPSHVHAHEMLALSCAELGLIDEAEQAWRRVIEIAPDHPDAEGQLAHLTGSADPQLRAAARSEAEGDLDSAERRYLRAIEIEPDRVEAHNDLGRIYANQGKLAESLECFARAVDIDPTYANAYFNAGDVLYAMGRYAEAADVYQNGLAVDPTHAPGFFTLGNCCFHLGAMDAAATAYRQALTLNPDYTDAANNLSLVEAVLQEQAA